MQEKRIIQENKNKLMIHSIRSAKIDKQNSNTLNSRKNQRFKSFVSPCRAFKANLHGFNSTQEQLLSEKIQHIKTPQPLNLFKSGQIHAQPFYSHTYSYEITTNKNNLDCKNTSNLIRSSVIKGPAVSKFVNVTEELPKTDFSEVKRKMGVIQAKFLNLNQNSENIPRIQKNKQKLRKSVATKSSIFSHKSQIKNNQFDTESLNVLGNQLQIIKKLNPNLYIVYLEALRSLKNSQQQFKELQSDGANLVQKRDALNQEKRKLNLEIMETDGKRVQQKSQIVAIQKKIMQKHNATDEQSFEREAIKQGFSHFRMILI